MYICICIYVLYIRIIYIYICINIHIHINVLQKTHNPYAERAHTHKLNCLLFCILNMPLWEPDFAVEAKRVALHRKPDYMAYIELQIVWIWIVVGQLGAE